MMNRLDDNGLYFSEQRSSEPDSARNENSIAPVSQPAHQDIDQPVQQQR